MNFKKIICYLFGHKWSKIKISTFSSPNPKRRSSRLNRKGGKKRAIHSHFSIKFRTVYCCDRCDKIITNKPKNYETRRKH